MPGAARFLLRAAGSRTLLAAPRPFHTSMPRRMPDAAAAAAAAPLPRRKPMGAFRGGLFGFLFGCVLSGGAVYSYLLQEYKASNDLLTEDIYTLQASVTRLANYVKTLEDKTQGKK
ncbi:hypothetical protein HRG_011503 [Hirsutella rhossiliensis]|uniref:Uncharacterized protein n=1 Tax=Hirsutella rhossiliensis TaxID=111463 RepID=A0A9P8MNP3_9HYPO|nr:uncharacterized protein HRG_11503 [Hirsutella rhossiliensis]KAH0957356.1 hypothetical protein HRG_11503 [Hirsutella rhossiliensis]